MDRSPLRASGCFAPLPPSKGSAMKNLFTIALAVASIPVGAFAQSTTYQRIGNTTHGSDGTTYQHIGNTTHGSDGTTYQRIGNTTHGSDGTTSQTIGNTTYITGPNGQRRTCQRIGNTVHCD